MLKKVPFSAWTLYHRDSISIGAKCIGLRICSDPTAEHCTEASTDAITSDEHAEDSDSIGGGNLVHNFLGVLDNLTFDKKSVVLHNLMNPSRAPGKTSSSRDDMEPKL